MWKKNKNYSLLGICCGYYSMSYNVTYTTYVDRGGMGKPVFVMYNTKII